MVSLFKCDTYYLILGSFPFLRSDIRMRLFRAAVVVGVTVLLSMACVSAEELSPVKSNEKQQVSNTQTGEKEPPKQTVTQSDSSSPVSSTQHDDTQRLRSPQEDATKQQHIQESTPKTSVPESSDTGESHDRSQRDPVAGEGKPSQQPQPAGSRDANVGANQRQSPEVGVRTPQGATQTAGVSSINTKEQATSDKKNEQVTSDKKNEQATSDKKNEQATSDKKNEQATSDKKNEQVTSDKKNEQATSGNTKEQVVSENKKEQATSENKKEQAASENKKEQATSENTKQQATSENKKEQATSDNTRQQAASENTRQQATSDNTRQQAASENTKQQATSENTKQKPASENKKEQATSDKKNEQVTSDKKNEQATSENTKQQAASENKKEQATSENKKEQAASENKKEQATSENKKEQATSDNRQVLQQETSPPHVESLNDDADDGLSDIDSDDEEAQISDGGSTTGTVHQKRTALHDDDHRYIRNFRKQLLEEPDIDAGNIDLSDPKRFAHRHTVYKSMGLIDPIDYGQLDLDLVSDIFTKRSEDGTLRTIVLFLPEPSGRRKMHIHRQRILDSGDVWEDFEEHYEIGHPVAADDTKQGMVGSFVFRLNTSILNESINIQHRLPKLPTVFKMTKLWLY